MWVGTIQSNEDPHRTKGKGRRICSLLELRPPSSLGLRHHHSWFLGLQTLLGPTPSIPLALRGLQLVMPDSGTPQSLESPALVPHDKSLYISLYTFC